jgi:hypothetical protein
MILIYEWDEVQVFSLYICEKFFFLNAIFGAVLDRLQWFM